MRFLLSILVVGLLTACGGNNMNDVGRDTGNNITEPTRVNDNREFRGGNNRGTQGNNNDLGYRVNDNRLDNNRGDRMGDNRLDNNRGNRMGDNGLDNNRGNRLNDNRLNNNHRNATDGLVNDRNDTLGNNATRDYSTKGRLGNDNNPSNKGTNVSNRTGKNEPNMRVADKVADRIASINGVDSANVLVTDNNAYVAAKLKSGQDLSKKLENKISNQVKSVDRDIDNVYVSVNADFYDRTTTYAQDIRQGRPVSGFFNEFTDSVRRLFPNNVQK